MEFPLPDNPNLDDFYNSTDGLQSPYDTDEVATIAAVERLTRTFIYKYLSSKFNNGENECLSADAINLQTLAGKVTGAAGWQPASILSGSIGNSDIANNTITGSKLAAKTITGAQIADATIESRHIKEVDQSLIESFPAEKLTGVVTKTQVGVLDEDNLEDGCVTADKIPNGILPISKLSCAAGDGYVIVSKQNGLIYPFNAVQISGDATMDGSGVVTIPNTKRVLLLELSQIGDILVNQPNQTYFRGNSTTTASWVCYPESNNGLIAFDDYYRLFFRFLANGQYRIVAKAVTYNNTFNQVARFATVNKSQGTIDSVVHQSPKVVGVTNGHVTSQMDFVLTVASTETYYGLFTVILDTVTDGVANGLGKKEDIYETEFASLFIERI